MYLGTADKKYQHQEMEGENMTAKEIFLETIKRTETGTAF